MSDNINAIPPFVGGESDLAFYQRLTDLVDEIDLGMDCTVVIDRDAENEPGRFYFQIRCWRMDVITKEMGWGYGGKAYLSPHATDSELLQTVFGLYKSYWEHEARENFQWQGVRIYGPHVDARELLKAARHVDVRSAQHVEDRA